MRRSRFGIRVFLWVLAVSVAILPSASFAQWDPPPPPLYLLSVTSSNPASGMDIWVDTPDETTGDMDGTTPFSRRYLGPDPWDEWSTGTMVTLTAGETSPEGPYFLSWTGCDPDEFGFGMPEVCTVTMNRNRTVRANYATSPFTLAVRSSNPSSGVDVTVDSMDMNEEMDGTTPFNRQYIGTYVTLNAPMMAEGRYFHSWTGCTDTVLTDPEYIGLWEYTTCGVAMTAGRTVSANYTTLPTLFTLTVNSANPAAGAVVTAYPADAAGAGSGATPFSLRYPKYWTATLTAAKESGGRYFVGWTGCDEYGLTGLACTVTMAGNKTVSAEYSDLPPLGSVTVSSSNPASGVAIKVTPDDFDGNSDGPTPLTRRYVEAQEPVFVVTAPPTAGAGKYFGSWTGCSYPSGTACTVYTPYGTAVTANYVATPPTTLAKALDQDAWTFTTGPAGAEWYGNAGWTRDGDAARSTAPGAVSWLETTRTIPAGGGYLSFWWASRFSAAADSLKFFIDGVEQAGVDGTTDWQYRVFPVTAGVHALRWELDNRSGSKLANTVPRAVVGDLSGVLSGGDAAVDQLQFSASLANPVPLIVASAPEGMGVGVAPADAYAESDGTTAFLRWYPAGTEVSLAAPPSAAAGDFAGWVGCDSTAGEQCTVRATGGGVLARYRRAETVGLAESLDQPAWSFSTGPGEAWVGQATETADGVDAAVSGFLKGGESTFLETSRAFSDGSLGFRWRLSSENGDLVKFYVDDMEQPKGALGDPVAWRQQWIPLDAGVHTLRWVYEKGVGRGSGPLDAAGVDMIQFVPVGLVSPPSVTASRTTADRITVTWGDVPAKTGFRIYRGSAPDAGFVAIGTTEAAVRTYDDLLGCGTTWYYRVAAFNEDGESVLSAVVTGSTALCAPGSLTAGDGTGKFQIPVAWGDVAGEIGYRLYRSVDGGVTFPLLKTLGAGETSYVDKPGCGSPTLAYRVRAYNALGESPDSAPDTGYTDTCGIRVDTPAGAWGQGSRQTITWGGAVNTGSVKIDLYKGTVFNRAVVASTPNDGSHEWLVPATLPPGMDYRLKVTWTGNAAINGFSGQFGVEQPVLAVESVSVQQGALLPARWSFTPAVATGNVAITFLQGTLVKAAITASTVNDGVFDWIVPTTLVPGDYTVRAKWLANPKVTGDGTVTVAETAAPITVMLDPANVPQGAPVAITWRDVPLTGTVQITLWQDGAAAPKLTIAASTPNDGRFDWTVPPNLPTGGYTVRVKWLAKPAVAGDAAVTVEPVGGTIVVDTPVSPVNQGETRAVTWSGIDGGAVKILLYKGASATPTTIVASTPNSGSYDWKVPGSLAPDSYSVQVVWLSMPGFSGRSGDFTVTSPALAVGQPAAAAVWDLGTTQTITWGSDVAGIGSVSIQLVQGGTVKATIAASTPNDESHSWAIPTTLAAGKYRVRVKWLQNPAAVFHDSEEFDLRVPGPLAVTEPAGAVQQGSLQHIRWSGIPLNVGSVKIDLLQGGVVKGTISASTPNDGEFSWTVPIALSGPYTLRVTWLSRPVSGTSEISVGAVEGTIVFTEPTSLTQVEPGATQAIRWGGVPEGGAVRILLFKGASLVPSLTIAASAPNTGFHNWTVPGALAAAPDYKVRVVWLSKPAISGESEAFEVEAPPTMSVIQPADGVAWNQGSTQTVEWTCGEDNGKVKIELYQGAILKKVLVASVPNSGEQTVAVPAMPVPASNFRVKVTWLQNPKVNGFSEGAFTIQ